MRALSSAQQPIMEGTNNDCSENDDPLSTVVGDRYQIANSCLPVNGDYQIAKRIDISIKRKSPINLMFVLFFSV